MGQSKNIKRGASVIAALSPSARYATRPSGVAASTRVGSRGSAARSATYTWSSVRQALVSLVTTSEPLTESYPYSRSPAASSAWKSASPCSATGSQVRAAQVDSMRPRCCTVLSIRWTGTHRRSGRQHSDEARPSSYQVTLRPAGACAPGRRQSRSKARSRRKRGSADRGLPPRSRETKRPHHHHCGNLPRGSCVGLRRTSDFGRLLQGSTTEASRPSGSNGASTGS